MRFMCDSQTTRHVPDRESCRSRPEPDNVHDPSECRGEIYIGRAPR
jgi:hypothetical protein